LRFVPHKIRLEYLDDELPKARRRALERHLAECEKCRRKMADLKALEGLARNKLGLLTPSDIPPAPNISLVSKLYENPRPSEGRRIFTVFPHAAIAAAALTVVFIAGLFLGLTLRLRDQGARARGGETKSTQLSVLTADSVQLLSLNRDLSGYKPIEQPRNIIIEEVHK
jgi:anti-sigma factor RsiW